MKQNKLLSWIELSQSALKNNISSLAKLSGGKLLAVSVKANAYGHGLLEVVSLLKNNTSVDYLTVHSQEEAINCRLAGWLKNILVMGPLEDLNTIFEFQLEPVIFELRTLGELGMLGDKYKTKVKTHLKLETGTNRLGITEKELPKFIETYKKYKSLAKPYGAYTHFANIEDTTNHEYAQYQLKQFNRLLKILSSKRMNPKLKHTASSAATILFGKTHFDMVRPGISVYGYWPSKETYLSYRLEGGDNKLFKEVLSWKSRVIQLKDLPPDSFVGYGCTYRTTSKTKLAVLPVGYYDGYDRGLSNQGYVLIKGKRAPVRGRVCMNIMMVDVSDIPGIKVGEEVILLGKSQKEKISADNLADWANSINYEILSRMSPHIVRLIE